MGSVSSQGDDPADPFNWDAIPEQLRGLVSVYERVNAVVKRGRKCDNRVFQADTSLSAIQI